MATRTGGEEFNTAGRQAMNATREAAHQSAEQAERIGRATAEVNSTAARAGAEMLGRNVEAAQQVLQSGAEVCAKLTERSAHQFGRALGLGGEGAEKTAQTYSKNLNAILNSSATLAELTKGMTQEWLNFGQGRMERNFEQLDRLLQSRTPQDFFAKHSELMKENLEDFLAHARRLAEQSIRTTENVAQKFNQAAE